MLSAYYGAKSLLYYIYNFIYVFKTLTSDSKKSPRNVCTSGGKRAVFSATSKCSRFWRSQRKVSNTRLLPHRSGRPYVTNLEHLKPLLPCEFRDRLRKTVKHFKSGKSLSWSRIETVISNSASQKRY
jgi:hypothetical protein